MKLDIDVSASEIRDCITEFWLYEDASRGWRYEDLNGAKQRDLDIFAELVRLARLGAAVEAKHEQ